MWFIRVPENVENLLAAWQVSQDIVVGRWLDNLVTRATPVKLFPVSWQVAQPLTIPVWFIDVPENDVNAVDTWQVSHDIVVGM